jgi:prepilin peptidase CpaA
MSANVLFAGAGAVVLVPLMAWTCVTDVRSRRVPNTAVAAIAVMGLAATLLVAPPGHSVLLSFGGIATGLGLWLPFYALGMLGAGDVKLFAAAAAWLGPRGALEGALLAAIAGGVLALGFMLFNRGAAVTLLRLWTAVTSPGTLRESDTSRQSRVPYALAMTVGVLGVFLPSLL